MTEDDILFCGAASSGKTNMLLQDSFRMMGYDLRMFWPNVCEECTGCMEDSDIRCPYDILDDFEALPEHLQAYVSKHLGEAKVKVTKL